MPKKKKSPARKKSAKENVESIAEKILNADLARIIKKVNDGKGLTTSERNYMVQRSGSDTPKPPSPVGGGYAKSYVELAEMLGVTRKAIDDWKKKFKDDLPAKTSNNQYDVSAWRAMLKSKRVRSKLGEPDTEAPEGEIDLQEAKRLHEIEKLEERRIKNAIARGEWMPTDLVREKWNGAVKRAIALLRSKFENELPPICSGADAVSIQKENQSAIDEVCKLLSEG